MTTNLVFKLIYAFLGLAWIVVLVLWIRTFISWRKAYREFQKACNKEPEFESYNKIERRFLKAIAPDKKCRSTNLT